MKLVEKIKLKNIAGFIYFDAVLKAGGKMEERDIGRCFHMFGRYDENGRYVITDHHDMPIEDKEKYQRPGQEDYTEEFEF